MQRERKKEKKSTNQKKAKSRAASYIGQMKLYLSAQKSTFCNIICHHRSDLDSDSEILWIEINIMGTKPILVGSFCNLRVSLEKINQSKYSNIWLAGDFNCGDIIWETQSVLPGSNKAAICRDLIDISNDYGFEQVVEGPTRGNKTLELFFITNLMLVVKSSLLPGNSGHDDIPVMLLNSKPSTAKHRPRKVYLYNKADTTELKAEVLGISSAFKEKSCQTPL